MVLLLSLTFSFPLSFFVFLKPYKEVRNRSDEVSFPSKKEGGVRRTPPSLLLPHFSFSPLSFLLYHTAFLHFHLPFCLSLFYV